jgi:hypothetical protein
MYIMDFIFHILIFILILFFYIHINNQYKLSEDLEIFEIDYVDNVHLQEVCNLKQPIIFKYSDICPDFGENLNSEQIEKYNQYDVNVKDINDYWNTELTSIDYTILPFQSANTLISSDTNSNYFLENNQSFIEDSGLNKQYQLNDDFLKPPFTVQTEYDFQMGSKHVITPLRYHTNHRHFIYVNSGKISIKLTPFKSSKYLHPYKDYELYEFRSPINVWKPQRKYFNEMDKIKWLDVDVLSGYMIYIPSYWWYSIKYSDEPNTILTSFTYNNVMNILSNTRNLSLYYLQQCNIKPKIIKSFDELKNNNEITPPTPTTTNTETTVNNVNEVEDVEN